MAVTWRQHVKNTMSRMGKATHLRDALKEASKTWSSVKKDTNAVVGAVVGKTKRRRGHSGHKATKGKKHTRRTKSRKGSRRSRRGGNMNMGMGGMSAKPVAPGPPQKSMMKGGNVAAFSPSDGVLKGASHL